MNPIPEQHRQKAAWLTVCLALCGGAEGIRQTAYQDIGNPELWSICFGETKNVHQGDRKTLDECKAMLEGRLYEFGAGVDKCTTVELPPERKAAFTDAAYNLGVGRYCQTFAPLLNVGRTLEACDKLLLYDKAGGVTFPGLTKRRQNERQLCMKGLT